MGIIHSESWKVAYKGVVPDAILNNMIAEKSEEKFHDSFMKESGKNAVILNNGMIVGFMCLGKCRDEDLDNTYGEIWGIYLLPSFWRQGIGTVFIDWGIEELKQKGYRKISLWVLEDNMNARRFYEKMGFMHDGTVKELNIGKPLNEIRYIKIIA